MIEIYTYFNKNVSIMIIGKPKGLWEVDNVI
jgi:hypothetical protein